MEALANVNQFGVCELREEELIMVEGGWDWKDTLAVCLAVAAVGAVTVLSGGTATVTASVAGAALEAVFEGGGNNKE